jgi:hypothetical protein
MVVASRSKDHAFEEQHSVAGVFIGDLGLRMEGEMTAELPNSIRQYQEAHDRGEVDRALAAFAPEAAVYDDGDEWLGTAEIRTWLGKTSTEFVFTRTLLGVETTDDGSWEVRNRLEGNFPGNVVDLRYRFELDGDRIVRLTIAP